METQITPEITYADVLPAIRFLDKHLHACLVEPDGVSLSALRELFTGATFQPGPDGCWEIRPELVNDEGYGVLPIEEPLSEGYKERPTNRISYLLAHGPFPLHLKGHDGERHRVVVHHKCGNTRCFRPSHLQLTTDEDNLKWQRTGKQPPERHTCGFGIPSISRRTAVSAGIVLSASVRTNAGEGPIKRASVALSVASEMAA